MKGLSISVVTLLASSFLSLISASPHGHLQYHQQKRHHERRNETPEESHESPDKGPVVWVTDWVPVIKTVQMTTTVWIQSSSDPTPVLQENHSEATPTGNASKQKLEPGQFFEPSNDESFTPSPPPPPVNDPAPVLDTATSSTQGQTDSQSSQKDTKSSSNDSTSFKNTQDNPQQNSSPQPQAPSSDTTISTPKVDSDIKVAPDPAPAPSPAPAPAPTPDSITASTSDKAASSSGGCSSSSPCTGDITYYDPGIGYGACGWQNTKDEPVVALPHEFMGSRSNGNKYCGKTVTIVHNGKTSTAKVVDKCMGCSGFSIDLSDAAFTQLSALSVGRTDAKWWVNP